jgi:hypothetical protein
VRRGAAGVALIGLACSSTPLPRAALPSDPIAFIQHRPVEGGLSLADLRAALRVENPEDEDSLRPQLDTALALLVPSTGEVRAVPDAQPGDLPLDWSPDGQRLLVGRSHLGTRRLELFAWNRTTRAWQRLGRDTALSGAALGDGPIRVAWGARIAQPHGSSLPGVRLRTDSEGAVELAGARGGLDPDVASDGSTVVFVRPAQRPGAEGVIHLARVGSADARPIARGASPRFSHDGRWIVFTRKHGARSDVWLMRADGSARRAITSSPLDDEEYPSLSPDGAWVVYASARGRRAESQLYVTRLEDRREMQITSRGQNTRPVW